MCVCVQVSAGSLGGQKMALDPLELKSQAVNSAVWALGAELQQEKYALFTCDPPL